MKLVSFIIGIFFIVTANIQTSYSQTLSRLESAQMIQSMIQTDLNNVIIPTVLGMMLPAEREKALSVEVDVEINESVFRVFATVDRETGKRLINISTGFLTLVGSMVDADILAGRYKKEQEIIKYKNEVANFFSTYRSKILNGEIPQKPEPFYTMMGMSDEEYEKIWTSKEYDYQWSLAMRSIITIVLVHEYAHHIFGHLDETSEACAANAESHGCLSEIRFQEDEADDYAIRVAWLLNVNPLLFYNYFLIFAFVENGLHESTHSPSACRLEKFVDAGLQFSKADNGFWALVQNTPELKATFNQTSELRKQLYEICEEGGLLPHTSIPLLIK